MSGTANPSPLPEDVRRALEITTQFIDRLRNVCRLFHQVGAILDTSAVRKVQTPDGIKRLYSPKWAGGELVSDIAHIAAIARPYMDELATLGRMVHQVGIPLREEVGRVAKGQVGRWSFMGGALCSVREVVFDLEIRLGSKLNTKRQTPLEEAEFHDLAGQFEPHIDDLATEAVREARMIAFNRERADLLSPSPIQAQDTPKKNRKHNRPRNLDELKAVQKSVRHGEKRGLTKEAAVREYVEENCEGLHGGAEIGRKVGSLIRALNRYKHLLG
jgi:hypothetical protein